MVKLNDTHTTQNQTFTRIAQLHKISHIKDLLNNITAIYRCSTSNFYLGKNKQKFQPKHKTKKP